MLKILAIPKKVKLYGLILASVIAVGSLFYTHYDGIKNSLNVAQRDVQELRQALSTAEQSANVLAQENERLDRLLLQREAQRADIADELAKIQKAREDEYETNKEYAECAPVKLSDDYIDRLRSISK